MSGSHETDVGALVRMVNQIARNVGHHPADEAATIVATHLRSFWAPAMRAQLKAFVDGGGGGVDEVPREAVSRL